MDGYQKRGEGRVVVGLPERLERRDEVIRDLEAKLSRVQTLLGQRSILKDEVVLDQLEELLGKTYE